MVRVFFYCRGERTNDFAACGMPSIGGRLKKERKGTSRCCPRQNEMLICNNRRPRFDSPIDGSVDYIIISTDFYHGS